MGAAGDFRTLVIVQQATKTETADGQKTPAWSDLFSRMGDVTAAGGQEGMRDRQLVAEVTHRVRLRWDPETAAITTKHRLLVDGQELYIVRAYDPTRRRREIEIEAKERP